jgi:hypothetical protein
VMTVTDRCLPFGALTARSTREITVLLGVLIRHPLVRWASRPPVLISLFFVLCAHRVLPTRTAWAVCTSE